MARTLLDSKWKIFSLDEQVCADSLHKHTPDAPEYAIARYESAYGIGLCSVEELGWVSEPAKSPASSSNSNGSHSSNGSSGSPSRPRDKLCLLIRQYNLDPGLVKAYAADFCGTQSVKDASRELVESFISHLSSSAKEDLGGLICKLNSYSHPVEVQQ